jgi:hypothetical protein
MTGYFFALGQYGGHYQVSMLWMLNLQDSYTWRGRRCETGQRRLAVCFRAKRGKQHRIGAIEISRTGTFAPAAKVSSVLVSA